MNSPKVKICKDCRWYKHIPEMGESITGFGYVSLRAEKHECRHESSTHTNVITGEVSYGTCRDQRQYSRYSSSIRELSERYKLDLAPRECGPEGQYWEPKP